MNLQGMKQLVTSKSARSLMKVRKHSPVLLFAAGTVGMVGTVVLACKATLKLEETLVETNENLEKAKALHAKVDGEAYSDKDLLRDQTIIYTRAATKLVRLYAPAIGLGVLSVAAITGSHVVLTKRNIGLTAAYATLEKGFERYRQNVVAEYGEEVDEKFRRTELELTEVSEVKADGSVDKKLVATGVKGFSPYAVIFDESNKNFSKAPNVNQFFIQCQQNYANDLLTARGHVFLNEVYDMLGFPHTSAGAVTGWVTGHGDDFIDFGVFQGDTFMGKEFVNGNERSVILDFNVAGTIWDKI